MKSFTFTCTEVHPKEFGHLQSATKTTGGNFNYIGGYLHLQELFGGLYLLLEGRRFGSLQLLDLGARRGGLRPIIAIAMARPPGFFWLFAIGELVSNKPCAILAASWSVSADGPNVERRDE